MTPLEIVLLVLLVVVILYVLGGARRYGIWLDPLLVAIAIVVVILLVMER